MAIAIDKASLGTNSGDSSATTIVLTTTDTVVSNGFIVLLVGIADKSVTLSSVASSPALTWTVDHNHDTGGGGAGIDGAAIASAQAPSGFASGSTITATISGATARNIGAMSFTGVASSSPVDTVSRAIDGGAGVTAWSTGNVSVLAGSVLVTNAYSEAGDSHPTVTTGTEAFENFDPDDNFGMAGLYQIATSAGNYVNSGSFGVATRWVAVSVAYKAAAGGGDPWPPGDNPAAPPLRLARSNLRLG